MSATIEKSFTLKSNMGTTVYTLPGINSNIAVVGSIDYILDYGEKQFIDYLKEVKNSTDKKLILIDFYNRADYKEIIKKVVDGEDIIIWKEYRSSNGTQMIISLIKIK